VPTELEENEAIGVKRAAQRKLNHELGIKPEQVDFMRKYFMNCYQLNY
jgi:isopentenyldiphosphate isomerase